MTLEWKIACPGRKQKINNRPDLKRGWISFFLFWFYWQNFTKRKKLNLKDCQIFSIIRTCILFFSWNFWPSSFNKKKERNFLEILSFWKCKFGKKFFCGELFILNFEYKKNGSPNKKRTLTRSEKNSKKSANFYIWFSKCVA